jgi:hypothetical protein
MTRVRWATQRSRAPFAILASRLTMPLKLQKKSRSEVAGQSCSAVNENYNPFADLDHEVRRSYAGASAAGHYDPWNKS